MISNRSYSLEEIRLAASRRPYGVYTSDVIDLTNSSAWNSFTWTELGVNTGDGETLKDATSLVAQWNFNETSGATATNNAGSCGASCNGTLTNFASTGSRDAAAGTGWTANNKRWGTGALMFDGTNDYAYVADNNALDITGSLTVEAWIKPILPLPNYAGIVTKYDGSSGCNYVLQFDSTGTKVRFGGCALSLGSGDTSPLSDGTWNHVVGVYDAASNVIKIYKNGVLESQNTVTGSLVADTNKLTIGLQCEAAGCTGRYFKGSIDSVRIYSRALTTSEILSNYNSSNLEFQTRAGNTTDPNDGTWEAWKPTTNETAIENFDAPYFYPPNEPGLVSYWPMDETSNGTCTGNNDVCDRTSTNHGEVIGATIVDGVYGKARSFSPSNDQVNIGDPANGSLDFGAGSFTAEAWFRMNGISGYRGIMSKWDGGSTAGWFIGSPNGAGTITFDITGLPAAQIEIVSAHAFNDGNWHHLAAVKSGLNVYLYIDGVLEASGSKLTDTSNSNSFRIGTRYDGGQYWDGLIDEVRIYNIPLSDTIIKQQYTGSVRPVPESIIKAEGSASSNLTTGKQMPDKSTVGLWHFDETGGTGAYVKDSSVNSNNGTPTGTTIVNGLSGKARSFNGTSDYISIPDSSSLKASSTMSFGGWFNLSDNNSRVILFKRIGASEYAQYAISADATLLYCLQSSSGSAWETGVSVAKPSLNTWHHVMCTNTGTTASMYLDGVSVGTPDASPATSLAASTQPLNIGLGRVASADTYMKGVIDEVIIKNVALTAEETAEMYRMGT